MIPIHERSLDNFVLVHTMGKVGSTAIARSLEPCGIFPRHTQWLSPAFQKFMDGGDGINSHSIEQAVSRLAYDRVRAAVSDPTYGKLIRVITVVRQPVPQILSNFFHSLELMPRLQADLKQLYGGVNAASVVTCLADLATQYAKNPRQSLSDIERARASAPNIQTWFDWMVFNYLTWFTSEFEPYFGSVLLGEMGMGYKLCGNALLLRFEDLPTKGEDAIRRYIQRPQFTLLRDNVGTEKGLGALYLEVRDRLALPQEFVDYLWSSKYVRHFYGDRGT